MFSFFKKDKIINKEEQAKVKQESGELNQEGGEEEIDNDMVIHTMPKRFHMEHVKVGKAKSTGLIIVVGGIVFLVSMSVFLYFYLFKAPKKEVQSNLSSLSQTAKTEEKEAVSEKIPSTKIETEQRATSSAPKPSLPSGEAEATSAPATTTPEMIDFEEKIVFKMGADNDNDGLTDKEEALLGSSSSNTDTDLDGYGDFAELLNLYDPAGQGKLEANPSITIYENSVFGYSLLVPESWEQISYGGEDSVIFKSSDNQFIQIIVQPSLSRQPIVQWYKEQFNIKIVAETDLISGNDWQGVKRPESSAVYLTGSSGEYIFVLTYNSGVDNVLEYNNIFEMMLKSLIIKSGMVL